MKKLFQHWEYVVLFIFCLTPVIWFWNKGGAIINGVDTNFPLDPLIWLQRRFFVWNDTANAGIDFSSSTAGIFFHLVQAIPYSLGLNLQQVQIISLIFWFSLIILSSYIFARTIFSGNKLACLLFVVFYSFNPYLFNTWENVKVANLALVASIPTGLALLYLLMERRIGKQEALLYSAVIGIILSGGGINPAYFITFFIILFIFLLARIIIKFNSDSIKNSVRSFLSIFIVIFLINLFWIIPTANFIINNISTSGSIENLGFTNWVDSLSENTSLLNVIRIQGAWDWYAFDGITGLPIFIPYALNYFYHPAFIFYSFLIPALAILAFVFRDNQKKELWLAFGIMLVLGVLLGAGTHPPTGSLFRFLSDHIPFFSLFRSPWYLFTPLVILSVAGLVGLLFYNLGERIKGINLPLLKPIGFLIMLLLIICNLLYTYPLVTGKIFRPGRNDSFYVNPPPYISEAKNWLLASGNGRVIGYPDDELEKFNWGYIGIESILNLFSNREALFSSLNAPKASVSTLIKEFYLTLKKDEQSSVASLAARLNIKSIFYKKDQSSLAPGNIPYFSKLPAETFGEWQFFKLPEENFIPKITASNNFMFGYPYANSKSLLLTPNDSIYVNPEDNMVNKITALSNSGSIVYSENSQKKAFDSFRLDKSKLVNRLLTRDLSFVDFVVEVPNDSNYRPALERYRLEDFGLDLTKEVEVEVDGKKTPWQVNHMTDSFVYFAPIFFTAGEHKLTIRLQNKNLTFGGNFNEGYVFKKGGEGMGVGKYLIEEIGSEKYLSIVNIGKPDISADFPVAYSDPMSSYYIELKYKQIYGNNGAVHIAQFNDNTLFKVQVERLPNYPEWQYFSLYYEPVMLNSTLRVELVAPFTADPLGTKVLYDDLRVQKVFINDLFFISEGSKNTQPLPKVSFKKISPVQYEGEIKDASMPFILNFSENYSPQWELTLYDEANKKIANKLIHFSANLYANAWYIENTPQNYKFRIYYLPQNLFKIGLLISLVTFLVVLTLFVKLKLKSTK